MATYTGVQFFRGHSVYIDDRPTRDRPTTDLSFRVIIRNGSSDPLHVWF